MMTNKHLTRSLTPLVLREMYIKTINAYYPRILKRLGFTTPGINQDVGQLELSSSSRENVEWHKHFGWKVLHLSEKINIHLAYVSAISLLSVYPDIWKHVYIKVFTPVFITIASVIAKTKTQLEYSRTGK